MDAREGTWSALLPWLGATLEDTNVNVRCNLVTLAAALAPGDPLALEVLAEMGATAAAGFVREEAASDRSVLETVLAERNLLPADAKTRLDTSLARRIGDESRHWNPGEAVDTLMRIKPVPTLLFDQLVPDAIISTARRIAAIERQHGDAEERDALRARLRRLAEIDAESPPIARAALRTAVANRLSSLPSRIEQKTTLFELLRAAPGLLARLPDGIAIANRKALDTAARLGRPGWFWLTLQAVLGSTLAAILLTGLITLELGISSGTITSALTSAAVGEAILAGLRLAPIGIMAGLPSAFSYTPTIGRTFGRLEAARRALLPAVAGGAGVTATVALFCMYGFAENDLELEFGRHPLAVLALLLAVVTIVLSLVAAMAPLAARVVYDRAPEGRVFWATCCSAGPAIGVSTLCCGTAAFFHWTTLAQLWPLLLVSIASMALAITKAEIATWPVQRPSVSLRLLVSSRFAAAASAVPLALALPGAIVPMLTSVTTLDLGLPEQAGTSKQTQLTVLPGRELTLRFDATKPLYFDFDADTHDIIAFSEDDRTSRQRGRQFRLSPKSIICIDGCEVSRWPKKMNDWLPILVRGAEHIPLTAQVALPAFGARKGMPLAPDNQGRAEAESGAGEAMPLELAQAKLAELTATGQPGKFGHAPMIAVYRLNPRGGSNRQTADRVFPREESGAANKAAIILQPGSYLVCTYFNAVDLAACDPKDEDRNFYEDGKTIVTLSLLDVERLTWPEVADQGILWDAALLPSVVTVPLGQPVSFTVPVDVQLLLAVQPDQQRQRDLVLNLFEGSGARPLKRTDNAYSPKMEFDLHSGQYKFCVGAWSDRSQVQCNAMLSQARVPAGRSSGETVEVLVRFQEASKR